MKKFLVSLSLLFAVSVPAMANGLVMQADSLDEGTVVASPEVIHLDFSQIDHITLYAQAFQGVPYRWGGVSETTGFDCSGFMLYLFNEFGYKLPHSAASIAQLGTTVQRSELQKGDLVFFKTSRKRGISHVGMVIDVWGDEVTVIHASSSRGVVAEDLNKSTYLSSRFAKAVRLDLDAIRKPTEYASY